MVFGSGDILCIDGGIPNISCEMRTVSAILKFFVVVAFSVVVEAFFCD